MRDLSLHILDLIENSIRAGASVVAVAVEEIQKDDVLRITIEDNGPGLEVPAEVALDPFYTTKKGKKTGLGLSLLRGAAERAGGRLTLGRSPLGGLAVEATMQLSHVDRSPMGDLAATISSVVCTNPDLDLRFRFCLDGDRCEVNVTDLTKGRKPEEGCGLSLARQVHESIRRGLESLEARM